MQSAAFELRTSDGQSLQAWRWLPEGRPRAIVQIAHGLAEHSARYARLAAALNAAGYAVYASDHRGHGSKAAPADLGHFADEGGWGKVVGDLWTLNRHIANEQPGTPIVFLGHSLGSFLGRQFVAEHSEALAGAVFSGSNGKPPAIATLGRLIARAERLRLGKRGKSQVIFQMWFGDFNKAFRPARTAFDWLSRDEKEVDAYVADPLCGFPFTTQLAIDVLDALPRVTSSRKLGADPQGDADLRLLRRARSGRREYPGPRRGPEGGGLRQAHHPHLSGRAARDAQRDQPRRGDARPHRLARRGRERAIPGIRRQPPKQCQLQSV